MIFEIWHALDLLCNYREESGRLVSNLEQNLVVSDVKTDNDEGVMKCKVEINGLIELIYIKEVLEDDIVIYGIDNDVLMTKATMEELGLN